MWLQQETGQMGTAAEVEMQPDEQHAQSGSLVTKV